ncbi:unnamed protein product [Blepharisma stoltei]|uniref:PH domain-containing protein n=1 Tax=Blepharisma stoltei TaxID=1481888 RepID=A0AAU9IC78_9CILI|nr:unnamed protein product [Blepharisma stoltei]
MEGAIKTGWIEKKSHYLKKWRKRWLVLDENYLRTYKFPYQFDKSTATIRVSAITDASPYLNETSKDFCFKISTPTRQYLISATSDVDMIGWLNLINHARKSPQVPNFSSFNCLYERKALSEVSLISSFSKFKEILNNREQELIDVLDEAYQSTIEEAKIESCHLDKILQKETESYQAFQGILSSNDSIVNKIRAIQKIPAQNLNFKKFDYIEGVDIKVSVHEENLKKVISSNIEVCWENPQEVKVRRTTITRALKWRYTGERMDSLSFSVSEDVMLTGVGICMPYKFGGLTQVKDFQVLKGNSSASAVAYKHPHKFSMQFSPDESVFKVSMERPVNLVKGNKYTVMFCIEGSHTFKCVDCMQIVVGPGNVNWEFENTVFAQNHQSNRCDTVCGPIADFYYVAGNRRNS